MPVNCYCQGTNENCYYCYGTGIKKSSSGAISIRPAVASSTAAARKATRNAGRRQKRNAPRTRCPECGKPVVGLADHRRDVHGIQNPTDEAVHTASGSATARSNGEILVASAAPDQTARARRENKGEGNGGWTRAVVKLVITVPAEHAPEAPEQSKAAKQKARSSAVTRAMTVCPECGDRVRQDRLKKHKKKAHIKPGRKNLRSKPKTEGSINRRSQQWKPRKRLSPTSLSPARDLGSVNRGGSKIDSRSSAGGSSDRQYREERRLDGSRDYYNTFRENGRFGSHPLHDDYGDTAQP